MCTYIYVRVSHQTGPLSTCKHVAIRTAVRFSKNEWFSLHGPISINHISHHFCYQYFSKSVSASLILGQPVYVSLFYYFACTLYVCECVGGKVGNAVLCLHIISYMKSISCQGSLLQESVEGSVISRASVIKHLRFPIVI